MGIQGLLPLLKSIQKPCNLQKYKGLTLGVDAYGWLHRGTVACAIELALGKPTTKFVEFAMHRVRMLIHFGITPYIVFDGDYLPSKAATEDGRAKRREESRKMGLKLYHAGKLSQAQNELQKAVDVTPEMAKQLIDELKRHNVKYVVAPYEADAQMAYLERENVIQGIISEDSDLLVFGAKRLLTKLDQYGECIEINRNEFTACKAVSLVGWSDTEFRHMAILSGCDYLDSMDKMGLKTAYRLVRKYKRIERIIQVAQFDGKFRVPENYLDSFRKADMTFLHQRVYCPKQKRVIMATELTDSTFADVEFLGHDVDEHIGRGVARGDLHPMTKQPLISQASPLKNSPSPWGINRKASASTPTADGKSNKSIDSFFKPRRVPLAELDPNSFTPSPSQRQVQEVNSNTWFTSPLVESGATPATAPAVPAIQSRRPLGQRSVSSNSSCPPPKRQRLCDDSPKVLQDSTPTTSTRSRFFQSKAPEPSPLLSKKYKKKSHDMNIYSDDSIDQALAELPDIDSKPTLRASRISIFREESSTQHTPPAECRRSVQREDTASTVTSFGGSQSQSLQDTQATSQSTTRLSRNSSTNGEGLKDMLKDFKHQRSSANSSTLTKPSRIPGPKDATRSSQSSQGLPKLSVTVVAEPKLAMSQAGNTGSHVEENLTSPIAPRASSPTEAQAGKECVPESPQQLKTVITGSEDCLVPNSEDELDQASESGDADPPLPTINLGRFLYSKG